MTTNEMIWKTLTTKTEREPKYRSVLADMGIEIYDSECSEQGFWAVRDVNTGRNLVVSRDDDGKRRLYGNDGCWGVDTKNVRLVDYIGYLRCPRKYKTYYDIYPERSEYSVLRDLISTQKSSVSMWEWEIRKVHKKICELTEERDRYEKYWNNACDSLDRARKRVDELRWKM